MIKRKTIKPFEVRRKTWIEPDHYVIDITKGMLYEPMYGTVKRFGKVMEYTIKRPDRGFEP